MGSHVVGKQLLGMKTLRNRWFLLAILIAAIHQVLQKGLGIHIPIVHAYLDDLLIMPILLTLGLAGYRTLLPTYRLSGFHVWPLVIIHAVYFEWYLPEVDARATGDPLDVLCYAIGGMVFLWKMNDPPRAVRPRP